MLCFVTKLPKAWSRSKAPVEAACDTFPSEQVTATGLITEYVRTAEPWNHFYFCPNCGSTTHWTSDKEAELVGIAVGAFAVPSFGGPRSEERRVGKECR